MRLKFSFVLAFSLAGSLCANQPEKPDILDHSERPNIQKKMSEMFAS